MFSGGTLLGVGITGAIVTALCCFTPILVILLGIIGLSAYADYLDYVLLPTLAVFVGLILYALHRQRRVDACCATESTGPQEDNHD